MTERLYLQDSFQFSCDAVVTSCAPLGDGYGVTLDRTVFFPNKGGQPCDVGRIDDAVVRDCSERGDDLLHLCDKPLPVGKAVRAEIDGARRFDIMQQHTGEHLLSYCAWSLFSAANVGFHCALTYATLDLDCPLSKEQICAIEQEANRLAAQDRPVTAKVYATEEEIDVKLRKHAEGLTAPIRIVTIAGSDACTCCAPHVRTTGAIGQLKIAEILPYKGGVRLTFYCGARALHHAQAMQDTVDALALRFSTGKELLEAAVAKQAAELSDCKKALKAAYANLDDYLAAELRAQATTKKGVAILVAALAHVDAKRLRSVAQKTQTNRSVTVLFSVVDDTVHYILSANGVKDDMGALIQAVNVALNGKGGGRGSLAQGCAAAPAGLSDAVEQLRDYFMRAVQG